MDVGYTRSSHMSGHCILVVLELNADEKMGIGQSSPYNHSFIRLYL